MKEVSCSSFSCTSSSSKQPIISSYVASTSIKEDCNNINTYLSEDVLIEIFIRLPLESIFTFRCVSKLWFSLLNPSSFITNWFRFNRVIPPPWAFFYNIDRPINDQPISVTSLDLYSSAFVLNHGEISFKFLPEKIYLLASSNGLILGSPQKRFHQWYYICNPITKNWLTFNRTSQQYLNRSLVLTGFICECSYFSSISKIISYKVVLIPENPPTSFDVDIFSSDTCEWSTHKLVVSCPGDLNLFCSSGSVVSLNKVLYWMVGRTRVIAYDLFKNNKENGGHQYCRLIDLPDQGDVDYGYLGESEGFISYSHCQNGELSIWVLDDYFSRGSWDWRLTHKIKIEDMLLENCEDRFKADKIHTMVNLKTIAFNPVDQNVVILGDGASFSFAYNIKTRRLKWLYCDSTSSGVLSFVPAIGSTPLFY